MQYPETFKQEILNNLGGYDELKIILDNHPEVIGQLLEAFANAVITPEEVVKEFKIGNSRAILTRAENIIAGKKLYAEWLQLNDSKSETQGLK